MKKYIFILLAVMLCANGYAQNGRHAVGASVNLANTDPLYCFLGLKYQYNINDLFRIEVGLGYDVNDYDGYFAGMNLHTFFLQEGRVRPYLITGVSLDNYTEHYDAGYYSISYYSYHYSSYEENESALGGKVGLGLNYRLTHSLDVNIEACYSTTYKVFGGIAFAYNF